MKRRFLGKSRAATETNCGRTTSENRTVIIRLSCGCRSKRSDNLNEWMIQISRCRHNPGRDENQHVPDLSTWNWKNRQSSMVAAAETKTVDVPPADGAMQVVHTNYMPNYLRPFITSHYVINRKRHRYC